MARRIGFPRGVCHAPSVVSHPNDPEVLLIRISHWLWKWYRAEGRPKYLSSSIDSMVAVKDAYREPMRRSREAAGERFREMHRAKRR